MTTPHDDVSVEAETGAVGRDPVVVVGSASVVGFTAAERRADAGDENGAVLRCRTTFPLGRREIRVVDGQFLGVDKNDLLRQLGADPPIALADKGLGVPNDREDGFYCVFEGFEMTILLEDNALPIPLIDIERVQVVEFLVRADRIHVRVESFARLDSEIGQGLSLPFGQRLDHFDPGLPEGRGAEAHRAFDAVEIIVQAGAGFDDQRRRHPPKVEGAGQALLEDVLDRLDGPFGFADVENGRVGPGLG